MNLDQGLKCVQGTLVTRRIKRLALYVYFPLVILYLEIIFHSYMGLAFLHLEILILFSVEWGITMTFITTWASKKVNYLVMCVTTALISLLFIVEVICKVVLQEYYQIWSSVSTAKNNSIWHYWPAIAEGMKNNWLGMLLLLLPLMFLLIVGRKVMDTRAIGGLAKAMIVSIAILVHVLALIAIQVAGTEAFSPNVFYESDTNAKDQVEQFGVLTMLRLDVKHTLIGVSQPLEYTFAEDENRFEKVEQGRNIERHGLDVNPQKNDAKDSVTPSAQASEVDRSPNCLTIDFSQIAKEASNENVKWISEYANARKATNKNEYTGYFSGYNVIMLSAEGFDDLAVSEELMPTIYNMQHNGFYFKNFYSPLHFTSTSGGEYRNLVGLYPKNGMPISMKEIGENENYLPMTIAHQLSKRGYVSEGYHLNGNMYERNLSHPVVGYDWHQVGSGMTMETNKYGNNVWPQSDLEAMKQSIDQYIDEEHFGVYYMTISGHMPYGFSTNAMSLRNKDAVDDLPYTTTTKAYIAANIELEKALTYLNRRLEETGKADHTLIVMAPDHIPYFDIPVLEELAGKDFGTDSLESIDERNIDYDVYRNGLIIWSASMKQSIEVDKVCSQIDILPTLSNLLGLDFESRLLAGTDILSEASPTVIFSSSSWITDYGTYNRGKGTFTLASGLEMTSEEQKRYVENMNLLVKNRIEMSNLIRQEDYYIYLREWFE